MSDNFIVFGAPKIMSAEIDEVVDSLRSGWVGKGLKVARFEEDFSAYKKISVDHSAALSSCTAGLHSSLLAAGIGPGDEVITTSMTFCATINAIIHCGATPVLVDIIAETMNIDPAGIEAAITKNTKAIIPVHFAGRPCDMEAIMALANTHQLRVIEDCAHAIESEYKGQKAGTIGDFGCFSFYATKNITTGDGGMVVARKPQDIEFIKTLSQQGMSRDAWARFGKNGYKHYAVEQIGFKYSMTDLQAAIGIHQLARIDDSWLRRRELWDRYQGAFADLLVTRPRDAEFGTRHAYHLYTLLIDEKHAGIHRDEFLEKMTQTKIGVGVHYLSIAEHPYYSERFGWRAEDYPNAMGIGRQTVSLPLSASLTDEDQARVIDSVRLALEGGKKMSSVV